MNIFLSLYMPKTKKIVRLLSHPFQFGILFLLTAIFTCIGEAHSQSSVFDWKQHHSAGFDPYYAGSCVSYDLDLQKIYMFNGLNPNFNNTYSYDGTAWQLVKNQQGRPPSRSGTAMTYDPVTQQTILFGGMISTPEGNEIANDTWAFDGNTEQWNAISNTPTPPARYNHCLASNNSASNYLGQTVLFGGIGDNGQFLNDTWFFKQNQWTQGNPSVSPSPRSGAVFTYDPNVGYFILFGGIGDNGNLNDTWIFNGTSWQQVAFAEGADLPSARNGASFAYSPALGKFVLFGGNSGTNTNIFCDDTWTFEFNTASRVLQGIWTNITDTAGTAPLARAEAPMVLYPPTNNIVLSGGNATNLILTDLWTFNSTWSQIPQSIAPPPRNFSAMVYDSSRDICILFGGGSETSSTVFNDTWSFDGKVWTNISPVNSPPARYGAAMTYNPNTQETILYGGLNVPLNSPNVSQNNYLNDTWAFDGVNWREITTNTPPTSRAFASMISSPGVNSLTLYGGVFLLTPLVDTWEFALTKGSSVGTWTNLNAQFLPQEYLEGTIYYDVGINAPALVTAIQFSFTSNSVAVTYVTNDWFFSGTQWEQITNNNTPPPGRAQFSLCYGLSFGALLFGGQAGQYYNDTWLLNCNPSASWTQQTPNNSPPAQSGAPVVYNSSLKKFMLYSSGSTAPFSSSIWTYGVQEQEVGSLEPSNGPNLGGTQVTINGKGFSATQSVFFGSEPAHSFTVISDSQIVAKAPPQASGDVDVTVKTSSGTTLATSGGKFTYKDVEVTSISPVSGPASGGTEVTLYGTNLIDVTEVSFGNNTGTILSQTNDSIKVITPAGCGKAKVVVGSSSVPYEITLSQLFTYIPPPPKHLKAKSISRKKARLYWNAPDQACISKYMIYSDVNLTKKLASVPAKLHKNRYSCPVHKTKTKTFFVVSIDNEGNRSDPVSVSLK